MYSIGTGPRFKKPKLNCDIACYSGIEDLATKQMKQAAGQGGFSRDARNSMISYGMTDNECDKFYNSIKAPTIKSMKSIGSGPGRFAYCTPKAEKKIRIRRGQK